MFRKKMSSRASMIDVYNLDTGSVEIPNIKRTTININTRIIKAETKIQNVPSFDSSLPTLVEPEVDKGNE